MFLGQETQKGSVIAPRKAIQILSNIVNNFHGDVTLQTSSNHIRITTGNDIFTSKLVDGRFPDYKRVIPTDSAEDKQLTINRDTLKTSLSRVAILANEKFKGAKLNFSKNQLILRASNPEQEQSEEIIDIDYPYEELEIGANISYLLDALANTTTEDVILKVKDATTSIRVLPTDSSEAIGVVMPMRV